MVPLFSTCSSRVSEGIERGLDYRKPLFTTPCWARYSTSCFLQKPSNVTTMSLFAQTMFLFAQPVQQATVQFLFLQTTWPPARTQRVFSPPSGSRLRETQVEVITRAPTSGRPLARVWLDPHSITYFGNYIIFARIVTFFSGSFFIRSV